MSMEKEFMTWMYAGGLQKVKKKLGMKNSNQDNGGYSIL